MYYNRHPREVPRWLKSAMNCPSFLCACSGDKGKLLTNKITQNTSTQTATCVQSISKQAEDNCNFRCDATPFVEIHIMVKKAKCGEELDMSEEWKYIADRFNKIFFILFLITHICLAFLCFAILPHIKWEDTLFSRSKVKLWRVGASSSICWAEYFSIDIERYRIGEYGGR